MSDGEKINQPLIEYLTDRQIEVIAILILLLPWTLMAIFLHGKFGM